MAIETWLLINHCWRLPITVSREDSPNFVKVMLHPGITWLRCQREAASAVLKAVEFSEHEQAWFLFSHWIEEMAVKVDTEDIESLVMWNPQRTAIGLPAGEMKDMSARRVKRATEIREFLQWFVDSSGIKLFERIEELESFYYMLMGSGLLYILETGKAFPLTFARMFAAPTRYGWQKEAGKRIKGAWNLPLNERVAQNLYSAEARAFDKQEKIEWLRPEIIPDETWRSTALATEKNLKAGNTDAAYVRVCAERIKKTLPLLLDAYSAYRKEKDLSTLAVCRPDVVVRRSDGRSFRKHRTAEEVAEAKRKWAERLAGHHLKKQHIIKGHVDKKATSVPSVPDILREGENVWDEDRDFLEPDYWK